MIDPEAIRAASVRIETRRSGERCFEGTGFFVGPGLVLTCSHVVARRDGADLLVIWSGKAFPCTVETVLPDPYPTGGPLSGGLPDLAILRCAANNPVSLLLDEVLPAGGEAFGIYGYSSEVDGEVAFQPLRCVSDGIVHVDPGWSILKLDSAGLLPGMSGCAIVSDLSGRVAAIAKRRIMEPAGRAYGVPATLALARFDQLRSRQEALRREAQARASSQRMIPLPEPAPFFVPRPEAMQALHDQLREGSRTAIVGPAGVGKTALAREFVSATLDRFQETLWLEAGEPEAARRSLLILAQALGLALPPAPGDLAAVARPVYAAIGAATPSWLLVLDGVEDLGLARRLLPEGSAARVLLTSRRETWTALGARAPVRLGLLDPEAAAGLVAARLGSAGDGAPVEAIAAAGKGLPGEIEQAAVEALGIRFEQGAYPPGLEVSSPAARLDRALASHACGALLRLLAVLGDAPLPLAPLATGLEGLRPPAAVEALTAASLAGTDPRGGAIRLAPGVGEAVRAALSADELSALRQRARDWLVGVLDREFQQSAPSRLAPRLLSQSLYLLGAMGAPTEAADIYLCTCAARCLTLIGDGPGAERLLESRHPAVGQAIGTRFGLGARAEFFLCSARVQLYLGHPEAARQVLDEAGQALAADAGLAGDLPADFAAFVAHEADAARGEAFALERRFAEAEPLLRSALLYFAGHARGAVQAAFTLESLMSCLMRSGKVAGALGLLPAVAAALGDTPARDGVRARVELFLGIAFLETAGSGFPSNLIQVGHAETHLERALVLAEQALGEFDDVTASICCNLATAAARKAAYGRGDFPRAEALLERAIRIRRRLFGDGSPRLYGCYFDLGLAQVKLGRAAARESFQRALAVAARPEQQVAVLDELIALAGAAGPLAEQPWRDLRARAEAQVQAGPGRGPHPGESAAERNAALLMAQLALAPPPPGPGLGPSDPALPG